MIKVCSNAASGYFADRWLAKCVSKDGPAPLSQMTVNGPSIVFIFPPDSMQDAKKSIIAMTKKLDNNKNFPFIRSSPQEIWKMNGFMHSVYFSKFHLNK